MLHGDAPLCILQLFAEIRKREWKTKKKNAIIDQPKPGYFLAQKPKWIGQQFTQWKIKISIVLSFYSWVKEIWSLMWLRLQQDKRKKRNNFCENSSWMVCQLKNNVTQHWHIFSVQWISSFFSIFLQASAWIEDEIKQNGSQSKMIKKKQTKNNGMFGFSALTITHRNTWENRNTHSINIKWQYAYLIVIYCTNQNCHRQTNGSVCEWMCWMCLSFCEGMNHFKGSEFRCLA